MPGALQRRKAVLSASAFLATLSLTVLSACSSSGDGNDSSSTSAGTSNTSSSTGTTGEVAVGLIGGFSGAVSTSRGGVPVAFKAWAQAINASGGLAGKKVNVFVEDTAVGTQPGLADAKDLIDRHKVSAIVSFDEDPDVSTWLPYAQTNNIPVIAGTPSAVGTLKDPLAFPVTSGAAMSGWAILAAAKDAGTHFGSIACSEAPFCSQALSLFKSFASTVGVTVDVSSLASSSLPDYTSQCQNLKKVDAYYLGFAADAVKRIQDTCSSQGVKATSILTATTSAPFWLTDKAFANSTVVGYGVAPYFQNSTPATKAYQDALAKYGNGLANSQQNNAQTITAWAAGKLIEAAAKAGNSTTGPGLIDGMYALHDETLGGLVQPLNFVKGTPTWLPCVNLWKINDKGQYVAPDQLETKCVSADLAKTLYRKLVSP